MTRLITIFAVLVLFAAACGPSTSNLGSAASPEATPTANVVVVASESPMFVATAAPPTAAPTAAPTPEPSASMKKVRETVRACQSGSYVRAMIIVEVSNTGSGWAKLAGGDYTVYDVEENVVGTGSFTYTFPKYLAPGATGYLADEASFEDTKVGSVKRVEADGTYDNVDAGDVVELRTAKVQIKRESYGDGLHTTGTVTNTSSTPVDSAVVGSFFLDGSGRPIGYAYTNLIENLAAGKTKGFATLDSSCGVKRTSVKKVVTIAADSDY